MSATDDADVGLFGAKHSVARCAAALVITVYSTTALAHDVVLRSLSSATLGAADSSNPDAKPGTWPGPANHSQIHNVPIHELHLGAHFEGMDDRFLRARYWIMLPGGVIAQHTHEDRPAYVHVLSGEVIETYIEREAGVLATRVIRANDVALEKNGTTHWWRNESDELVTMIAYDILNKKNQDTLGTDSDFDPARKPGLPLIEELGTYFLEGQFPDVGGVEGQAMRGRRITILRDEETPPVDRNTQPCVAYVIAGHVLEFRSNGSSRVLRPGGFSELTGDTTTYWRNPAEEPATIFVMEFIEAEVPEG